MQIFLFKIFLPRMMWNFASAVEVWRSISSVLHSVALASSGADQDCSEPAPGISDWPRGSAVVFARQEPSVRDG